jgi:hypothetical protein
VNVYVPTVVDVHDAWAAIGAAAIIKAAIDGLIMIFSLRFWKPKLGIVHASPVLALSDHEEHAKREVANLASNRIFGRIAQ